MVARKCEKGCGRDWKGMWEKGQEIKGMKWIQGREKKGEGLRYERNHSVFNFNGLFTLVLNMILDAFQYFD
jgi:hypothetical protein